ncbi:Glycinol 4-dimethylallyltransferase [Spatholobus suberectus]|nr:Glycinol 4-dimethylallyltransferase [Spatholobus suberectus]
MMQGKRTCNGSQPPLAMVSITTAFKLDVEVMVGDEDETLAIISASLLAVEKLSNISPLFFIGVLQVAIPQLFMGIYSAGVNQLCDLEIDKINKPYLPLASGQISFTAGVIVAASCLTLVPYRFFTFLQ